MACAVPSWAVTVHKCVPGQPTVASYTWDFKAEANRLFQAVQSDADQARYHADQLDTFARDSSLSWDSNEEQLQALKQEVNDMGRKLCRLETIRRVVAPWQQAEIDRIATTVRLMADNTEDAIRFGNTHQEDLWLPVYTKYADNLYAQSCTLANSTENAVTYARLSNELRNLKRDL
jgi:hypothetical protein